MKVVFAGRIGSSIQTITTTRGRVNTLRTLGHTVIEVDQCGYLYRGERKGHFRARLFAKLAWGPPVNAYNRAIRRAVVAHQPDLLWIEKGQYVWPQTLEFARKEANCRLMHYTPDAALLSNVTRHFRRSIPLFDLLVTNKTYELDTYRSAGARRLLRVLPTVDLDVHRPPGPTPEEAERFAADVSFVGAYVPGRERLLGLLAEQDDLNVAVWGLCWDECRHPALLQRARLTGAWGRDYSLALSVPYIAVNAFTPVVPDQINCRAFEIPASGGFLLCQRSEEALSVFEEGRHAAFFETAGELVEKVRYYLAHRDERDSIARAGHELVRQSHSAVDRLRQVMDEVADCG